MPLLTDCAFCGKRFVVDAAGTVDCPHCSQRIVVVQPAVKVPASDYWQMAKFLGWAFLAVVLLFAVVAGFIH